MNWCSLELLFYIITYYIINFFNIISGAHNTERATAINSWRAFLQVNLFLDKLVFFSVNGLSWLRVKNLLLMTQLLVIGFSKAIRKERLLKNIPILVKTTLRSCSMGAPSYGLLIILNV